MLKLALFSLGFVVLLGFTGGIWYLARKLDQAGAGMKQGDKDRRGGENPDELARPIPEALPVDDVHSRPPSP